MVTGLTCFLCGRAYDAAVPQGLCECGRPLRVDYDFGPQSISLSDIDAGDGTIWRYRAVLPDCEPLSLGEGWTPLQPAPSLGSNLWIKDEGVNPTASFKARGMAVAVAMARKFGLGKLAVPSAGNAGGALAAYCAKAGIEAYVFMPRDTPRACVVECEAHGARVTLVDGLITDCAAEIGKRKVEEGWFDMSTLKEPYRIEGKKTMGYEMFEQMGHLPAAIVYPAGGGTGLIGMWKAFDEMERLGWIGTARPKMFAVQPVGCCPIPTAFAKGERFAEEHKNAATVASGLRVPRAVGDFIMLDLIRASGGSAVTVSDDEMVKCAKEIASKTGVFASPEGGACLAAARNLLATGLLKEDEETVLFNTGSGVKYLEALG
ncbi:MAG: threonine synthase [Armatimonadetes bacterium]|nr:threonine synthase [Armatimonadota bacterium]